MKSLLTLLLVLLLAGCQGPDRQGGFLPSTVPAASSQVLDQNKYDWSDYETRLLQRLNTLYESYTIRYLGGDEEGFGYENPPEVALAEFDVTDGDTPQVKEMPTGASGHRRTWSKCGPT